MTMAGFLAALLIDPACSIVFEAEAEDHGLMDRAPRPVADYLKLQGRFAHLFKKGDYRADEELDHLQALADHNIATYGLRGEGLDRMDTTGIAQVKRGGPLAGRN